MKTGSKSSQTVRKGIPAKACPVKDYLTSSKTVKRFSHGLRIRRSEVRILLGAPEKSRGYGLSLFPFFLLRTRYVRGLQFCSRTLCVSENRKAGISPGSRCSSPWWLSPGRPAGSRLFGCTDRVRGMVVIHSESISCSFAIGHTRPRSRSAGQYRVFRSGAWCVHPGS